MQEGHDSTMDRRRLLVGGAVLLAGAPLAAAAPPATKIDPDAGVTAPEDLMKEHGVLNRCLLIYEEGLRRLAAREEVPSSSASTSSPSSRQPGRARHEPPVARRTEPRGAERLDIGLDSRV